MNATSDTAPYRHRYKSIPNDENVNFSNLEIEDLSDDEEDQAGEIMRKTLIVREAVDELEEYTDPLDIEAFFFRYFDGEPGHNWKEDNPKLCYDRSYKVLNSVKIFVENYETRKLKVKTIWYNFAV